MQSWEINQQVDGVMEISHSVLSNDYLIVTACLKPFYSLHVEFFTVSGVLYSGEWTACLWSPPTATLATYPPCPARHGLAAQATCLSSLRERGPLAKLGGVNFILFFLPFIPDLSSLSVINKNPYYGLFCMLTVFHAFCLACFHLVCDCVFLCTSQCINYICICVLYIYIYI